MAKEITRSKIDWESFFPTVPQCPGVYRIYDRNNLLIYVGKAKNLRRRLGQYKNVKRRKKHWKMCKILADAAKIEFQICDSEFDAQLIEAKLIQDELPKWNTAGAFYFLYPMIGIREDQGKIAFCYTTEPEEFAGYSFHGAYRSRGRTREAYFALTKMLRWVGHLSPPSQITADKRPPKYSYVNEFRQLPHEWLPYFESFFKGETMTVMELIVFALLENAGARKRAKETQELLNSLRRFWRHEAQLLARIRERVQYPIYPVDQRDRDIIFVLHRYRKAWSVGSIQGGSSDKHPSAG